MMERIPKAYTSDALVGVRGFQREKEKEMETK